MRSRATYFHLLAAAAAPIVLMQAAPGLAGDASKKPKICVVQPSAQLGQGASGVDVSEPVRQTFIAYLSGPATEIAPLTALVPVQYNMEARNADCDFVLTASVAQKKSKGSSLLKIASVAAPVAGMAGTMDGSASGMAAAQAAAMAGSMAQQQGWQQEAMAQISQASQSNVRKGDKLTLEYALNAVKTEEAPAAAASKPKTLEAKAKEHGEDILSPLVEQAATEILASVIGG